MGPSQQYVNDTIRQKVNDISITDTAIARLETKGHTTIQEHMPKNCTNHN